MWPSVILRPRNWVQCDGSLLKIRDNQALFSVIMNIYGGDGREYFALPDLRGRVPMGMGNGPGLTKRDIGSYGGEMNVQLHLPHLPAHSHKAMAKDLNLKVNQAGLKVSSSPSTLGRPSGSSSVLAAGASDQIDSFGQTINVYNYGPATSTVQLANSVNIQTTGSIASILPTGAAIAHNNLQPTMGICYLMCIDGPYPILS